ncbi:hypothetical protein COT20_01895 [bacterium (Candidatus Gribaldobacteria) CG08_land_8_20_14_0_20_39_15]|uniref:Uncharacterized protein n=1 Tax=bacterium (Candidatus Gribaldobacteria) CG08_land_8_20_14_0_20_39_15 TaxID=2014273 RepID=A0A2M6XUC8_9BACT|nr:MAG: hypothetical protein COT20_01895 [bacterium (Candidatus Gribaldobacteria) CG08_land_8_20_14_0_20_39_15]
MASENVIKILSLCSISALLAVLWTPFLSNFLYKYKFWRKAARTKTIDGSPATVFHQLHKDKEVNTPRMGGLLIWVTTIFLAFLFAGLNKIFPQIYPLEKLNFLSRNQTWLPLGILIAGSLLGLGDDILQIFSKGKYAAGGIRFTRRLVVVLTIALIGACWFYFKLGWHTIHIPGNGSIEIGLWYLPLFVITVLACWAGGVVDGLDGLAGGIFSIMFSAFSIIAYANTQYDLAALCAVIAGSTIAFLWFNIPPARFYMGETGSIGLTAVLAAVAFLTDSLLVLPIIAGLLVIEVGSIVIQLFSKKFFHKKVFLCSPIHHHLEAKGWSREKITMRFWLISLVLAIIGVAIRLLG